MLAGLTCQNCASKIEEKLNSLPFIHGANIALMTQTLSIQYQAERNESDVYTEVQQIVHMFEPDVIVKEKQTGAKKEENDESKLNPVKLITFGLGVILFAIGLVFKFDYWVEFTIFAISYLLVGGEVLVTAIKNIFRGEVFDENFLMMIATIGAFVISEFAEGVAVMLFYQIGEFFQEYAVNRSRKSITSLMDIRPDFARIKVEGSAETIKISPDKVKIGDAIIIQPGDRIPLDSVVLHGSSMLDTRALTGESIPQTVSEGDIILSGAINLSGVLTAKVNKSFGESTASKILELVQNAASQKAPTESFITKFSKYYTPIVVLIAVLIAIVPSLLVGTWQVWLHRALLFLVVSCPCALVISIPLGFFGGIGGASQRGILVKGGNYLEALNRIDSVVFDKTGTLTKGEFEVKKIETYNGFSEQTLLELAASAEIHSNHPIGFSIRKRNEQSGKLIEPTNVEEIAGRGVVATISNKRVAVGNMKLLEQEVLDLFADLAIKEEGTSVFIAVDHAFAGYITISDQVKKDSKKTIAELKAMNIPNIVMLTGDNEIAAQNIAAELGIHQVYGHLLPAEKVEIVEKLEKNKAKGSKVIFVGDGINDAPVLARADVGVAMGALGSDAAIEAADIVLMTDEPSKLIDAISIAKFTQKIVWQNIILALSVKVIVLTLGAFGIATMWEAVFADVGVALLAILNAMRVIQFGKKDSRIEEEVYANN